MTNCNGYDFKNIFIDANAAYNKVTYYNKLANTVNDMSDLLSLIYSLIKFILLYFKLMCSNSQMENLERDLRSYINNNFIILLYT